MTMKELAERVRDGLDLANTLSCDVPITAEARRRLTDAYEALETMSRASQEPTQ